MPAIVDMIFFQLNWYTILIKYCSKHSRIPDMNKKKIYFSVMLSEMRFCVKAWMLLRDMVYTVIV